jgi:hypothetical protein
VRNRRKQRLLHKCQRIERIANALGALLVKPHLVQVTRNIGEEAVAGGHLDWKYYRFAHRSAHPAPLGGDLISYQVAALFSCLGSLVGWYVGHKMSTRIPVDVSSRILNRNGVNTAPDAHRLVVIAFAKSPPFRLLLGGTHARMR